MESKHHLSLDAKMLAMHVMRELVEEKDANQRKTGLNKPWQRGSEYMGVPESSLKRWWKLLREGQLTESRSGGDRRTQLARDSEDERRIVLHIQNYLDRQNSNAAYVSVSTILAFLKPTHPNLTRTRLRSILRRNQFTREREDKYAFLREQKAVADARCEFLLKYLENEARPHPKPYVFVDESFVRQYHKSKWTWFPPGASSSRIIRSHANEGQLFVLIGACSEQGWVAADSFKIGRKSGNHHDHMDSKRFEEFVREKLIPGVDELGEECIIIMDNASYHRAYDERDLPKAISRMTAPELCAWLGKGEYHVSKFRDDASFLKDNMKADAYAKKSQLSTVVQKYAEASGHEVWYLPPYHPIFNPIEEAWSQVKQRVMEMYQHATSTEKVIDNIEAAFAAIRQDSWAGMFRRARCFMEEFIGRDELRKRFQPQQSSKRLVIPLSDSENDDSDDDVEIDLPAASGPAQSCGIMSDLQEPG